MSTNPIFPTRRAIYNPFAKNKLKEIENEACMCRIATKVAGCVCLPVSWACFLGCHCMACLSGAPGRTVDPVSKREYSTWTDCDGGCCWKPRLPPEDGWGQIDQVCDPFFCFGCGTPAHYLPPEKQKMWVELKKQITPEWDEKKEVYPPTYKIKPEKVVDFRHLEHPRLILGGH